jgi:hypothetical protein
MKAIWHECMLIHQCEEADLSWSDVGPGPYTVRVVDPQNPVPLWVIHLHGRLVRIAAQNQDLKRSRVSESSAH